LFVSGGAYAVLGEEVHRRGLEYCNTGGYVTASAAVDPRTGAHRVVVTHSDPGRTAEGFSHPQDRSAYLAMLDDLGRNAETVFGAFGAELRSPWALAKLAFGAIRRGRIRATEALLLDSLMSGRNFLGSRFIGWEADQLWSPWLLHAGLGPDHSTGGVMLPVMAMTIHSFGLPVVKGGAGRLVDAFDRLLLDKGVDISLSTEATQIVVEDGRVRGIRTPTGMIRAGTVLANVAPQALYGSLLAAPPKAAAAARRYRNGRGAMQIHLALRQPPQWLDSRLAAVPLIHLTTGADGTGLACAQAEARLLPAEPSIVVGQQCVLDSSRAPAGKATLWLQLQEVPFAPVSDAAGTLDTDQGWTHGLTQAFLDRVLDRIEEFAPGTRDSVLASEVLSPADLSAENVNAINGDPYGGSAELFQNLLWRPFPEAANHRNVVKGLWHIGASTHPGAGLSGGSGHLVAQTFLSRSSG
jgi:phytoene dehydrogenase-like protein